MFLKVQVTIRPPSFRLWFGAKQAPLARILKFVIYLLCYFEFWQRLFSSLFNYVLPGNKLQYNKKPIQKMSSRGFQHKQAVIYQLCARTGLQLAWCRHYSGPSHYMNRDCMSITKHDKQLQLLSTCLKSVESVPFYSTKSSIHLLLSMGLV